MKILPAILAQLQQAAREFETARKELESRPDNRALLRRHSEAEQARRLILEQLVEVPQQGHRFQDVLARLKITEDGEWLAACRT
jgi:hypothetical protein